MLDRFEAEGWLDRCQRAYAVTEAGMLNRAEMQLNTWDAEEAAERGHSVTRQSRNQNVQQLRAFAA